jgi:hypothetical protein
MGRLIARTQDVEHVLDSHGQPVHGRDDVAAALDRQPWSSWPGYVR